MKIRTLCRKKYLSIVLLLAVGLGIGAAFAADSQRDTIDMNAIVTADYYHETLPGSGSVTRQHEVNFNLTIHRLKDFLRTLE